MYLAHGPVAYLANEVIQKKKIKQLKKSEQILVALLSFFFGILPDFDILALSMFGAPRFIHHDIITHTPIFYIAIWLALKIGVHFSTKIFDKKMAKFLDKRLLNVIADTFLIATLFHLLADFLVNSIPLLYPLSTNRFHILKFILEPNIFAGLTFSTFFAIEVVFISIFFFALYKKFFKESKFCNIFLQFLIIASVLYLPFTIYTSLNTYNRSYLYDEGEISYDIDYDGVSDKVDMYVGNTGLNNLQSADHEEVLNAALDIVNSNKWTNNHENDLVSKIKGRYGGFNSYRLVAQAYYNIRRPIEPVLKDYHIKKYGFESYFYSDYDYPNLLLNYLGESEQLLELNLDVDPELPEGKIFFVIENVSVEGIESEEEKEKKLEILNLGITLEGNYLAVVLQKDESLTMHSYDTLREYYGDKIEKIYIQK
jgi:inner membrane protein